MIVIPAVDIRDGKCVRLMRGDFSRETVYAADPVQVALRWQEQGAALLHVVDLDGARYSRPANASITEAICRALRIPLQVGGGMRSLQDVELAFDGGAARVVLGTLALEDAGLLREALSRWGERIAVSLDARDGVLTTRGWLESSGEKASEVAARLASEGVRWLVYTDIARDGTLLGPNTEGLLAVMRAAGPDVNVIASGGVGSLADLVTLRDIGVWGAITGKALYTGDVRLQDFYSLSGETANG